ncbi:MAG TPA: hypothetical protein VLG47_01545 [Candidatus Saccharimonadales bacterium]|nr:hypothetical protein [Candidatus Saccharimonadales bacterium]
MTAKKMYFIMIGSLVGVGVLGIASLVLGNKLLTSKSSHLSDLRLQSQVLNDQQTALTKAKQSVIKYTPLNKIAQSVVPQEKDQARSVREIVSFANQNNIAISSITFPASNLGGTSVGSTTGGAPVATAGPKIAVVPSQLLPAVGLKGIYVLPITIQSDTTKTIQYSQLSNFLKALENNRHTAEVSQLTITPDDSAGNRLSFQIVINIYIKK